MNEQTYIADNTNTKSLRDKKIFIFYVPSKDVEDIENHLNIFKVNNPIDKFEDVVCLYLPTQDNEFRTETFRFI